jgi:hypothetical protein
MSAITVTRDGRLTTDSATLARLKALVAQDEAALYAQRLSPRRPWPPKGDVQPVATDDDIERTLIGLIGEVSVEAKRSFQLAREAVVPGGMVEMRSIAVNEACRLSKALALMVIALSRHRGKSQRLIIEHYVHRSV